MRLRTLRAALLFVLAAALVPSTFASEPGFQPRDPGAMYLALGDSLATGYEEDDNNDRQPGYPHVLLKYLRAINPALGARTDLARNFETSLSMTIDDIHVSSQLTRAREYIRAQRADGLPVGLVTVSVGMRDMIEVVRGRADRAAARATFKAKLEQICDELLGALRNDYGVREGDLVLVSLYNPYPNLEFPNKGKIADELVPEFNRVISEVAKSRDNVPVADVATLFAGHEAEFVYAQLSLVDPRDILDPDLTKKLDFHPRPAGHRAIAQSIMAATGLRYMAYLPLVAR